MSAQDEWSGPIGSRYRDVGSAGHRFGPDLVCDNTGCQQTWDQHQWWPIPCLMKPKPIARSSNGKTQSRLSCLCQEYGLFQKDLADDLGVGSHTVYLSFRGGRFIGHGRHKLTPAARRRVLRHAVKKLQGMGVDVAKEMRGMRREARDG